MDGRELARAIDHDPETLARSIADEALARAEAQVQRELTVARLNAEIDRVEDEMTEALGNPDWRVEIR